MKGVTCLLLAASCGLFLAACSVGMAISGKEQKDTSILFPGSPRSAVIAKLGPPETSTQSEEGTYVDTYLIVQGNAPSTGRAVAHAALDLVTLFMWELVATPWELAAGQEDRFRLVIYYDSEEKIKNVQKIGVQRADEASGK